jgi:hypothetical protein
MCDRVILPIVEGHGDERSIRELLNRIFFDMMGATSMQVVRPIRRPKSSLLKAGGVERAVEFAANKLRPMDAGAKAVLVLIDADDSCPAELARSILARSHPVAGGIHVFCVLPNPEFETWFAAGVNGCHEYLGVLIPPVDPEGARVGKGWVEKHYQGGKYSETLDQPRLTHCFDLVQARQRSRSFAKLCSDMAQFGTNA